MVNLVAKRIDVNGQDVPIKEFVVWFQTPFGLFNTLEKAAQACSSRDLLPELCVKPVAVAVGFEGVYEVCP